MLDIFLGSLSELFQPYALLLIIGSSIIGLIVGTLPGLNAAMAVAIILPLTYGMTAEIGLAVLVAVYISGISGGMVTAVLLNMPGTPSSVATTFEGYPMALRGEAVKALGTCALASFFGGVISLFILIGFAPIISKFAIQLTPADYFSISFMALALVAVLAKGDAINGYFSALLGLLIGTVGFSPLDGAARFNFGSISLMSGFSVVPVMIGLFALSQVLREIYNDNPAIKVDLKVKGVGVSIKDILANGWNIVRSSLIGTGIGILPGVGGTASNMIAYGVAQQSSKTPEKFSKGTTEGLWASESANNASLGGALLPLITLGIPGDGVTAILIGAFMIHGLQPGPLLYVESPQIISSIYAAFLLVAIFVLFFQFATLRVFPKVLGIPSGYLMPIIVVFSVLGSYASDFSTFDVWVMIFIGVFALLMGWLKLPLAPFVLGFVLGPIVETSFRRALMMSDGSYSIFVKSHVSVIFIFISIMIFIIPIINIARKKKI